MLKKWCFKDSALWHWSSGQFFVLETIRFCSLWDGLLNEVDQKNVYPILKTKVSRKIKVYSKGRLCGVSMCYFSNGNSLVEQRFICRTEASTTGNRTHIVLPMNSCLFFVYSLKTRHLVIEAPEPKYDTLWVVSNLLNLNGYLMSLVSKCWSKRELSPHI